MLRLSAYMILALGLVACNNIHQAELSETTTQKELALYDNMPADGVLGQLGFTGTSSPILDAQSLDSPIALTHIGDHLFVADFGNKRVTGYAVDTEGNPSDTANRILLQDNANQSNFADVDSDLRITPYKLTSDIMSRLYVAGLDSSQRWRVFVFDNPFADDTTPEYELLDLPENIGAFGSINSDIFVVIGGPDASNETIHFYATGHFDAPPLRQADVPSPCNGDGGTRGFVRLQDYLVVACAGNIYAANIDTSTGFLEPSPDDGTIANWTHVLTGFSNITSIDGEGGIVGGEVREEAFVTEFDNHRVIPLPNPVFYIETRQNEDLQAVPYDVTTHPDFQRFLGHADLSQGKVDPALAGGPNYHPDPALTGNPSEWGLQSPTSVSWNNENLWVADFNNNRVLRFSTRIANLEDTDPEIFTAKQVLGQVDFTHTYTNRVDGRSIVKPQDIALVTTGQSSHLLTADSGAHRLLVHTLADRAGNGTSADAETLRGQVSLYDYKFNQDNGNDNGDGFRNPMSVDIDPISNRVAVSDYSNNRIVIYDSYNSGTTPVAIIGRREGDEILSRPAFKDVAIHGNFVFTAAGETEGDIDAHRILIYDLRNLATDDGVPDELYLPTDALGQDYDGLSMPANTCNQNNSPGPDTVCNVQHMATDDMGNLWVSDTGNNRVIMFEDPAGHLHSNPTSTRLESTIADHVLGQPNMLSNTQYFGDDAEKTFRLVEPDNLTLTGGAEPGLWLIDGGNKRVLYFPTPHLVNETSEMPEASHVLGTTMSGLFSNITVANERNVKAPEAVAVSPDNKLVFIADSGFKRVLRFTFNDAPTISLQGSQGEVLAPHIQVEVGSEQSIQLVVDDPEGDEVTLEVQGLSPQLNFDAASKTLLFNAAELSAGYITYAKVIAEDSSPRANRSELALSIEIIEQETQAPTTQSSSTEREAETIPEGGCNSLPISTLTLVIPFLLIYRRRLNRI